MILSVVRRTSLAVFALFTAAATAHLHAQGCVAAHTNQRVISQLITDDSAVHSRISLNNLTVQIGYRVFNSNKYFQGSREIPRNPAVENHQNIFDIGVEYRLSPRWSLLADVPVFNGTRDQIYPPKGIYQVSGLGDMLVGAQGWIFRPPTENGGNVAISLQLKIPTGINNATGTGLLNGQYVKATADQSLQPGDGSWGFAVGTQGYKRLWHSASAYGQASYLFNPADTNGVATFRTQPGQGIMSVTDQYLYRGGVSQSLSPIATRLSGIAFSLGIRGEGVPVRDLLGSSNGFRRPGDIVSLEPGLMLNYRRDTISVNGPWALYRNRPRSVPEIHYGTLNGDAFFADYTVIASLTHHF